MKKTALIGFIGSLEMNARLSVHNPYRQFGTRPHSLKLHERIRRKRIQWVAFPTK